jgi:hypothetical protein
VTVPGATIPTAVEPRTETAMPAALQTQSPPRRFPWQRAVLALLLVIFGTASLAATRHTSTTFDEIFPIAGGARGYETGEWNLVRYHPRLMQYIYGLPVFLAKPNYPEESGWSYGTVWAYSQQFFFQSGNDPERLAFLARSAGVFMALLLGVVVFAFVRRWADETTALLAAWCTLFLPDVVAHAGVAYNDVPIALFFFAACWAIDVAARDARVRAIVGAAAVATLAVAMKFTAIALLPVAAALVAAEAYTRSGARLAYLKRIGIGSLVALPLVYLILVAIYLGDFSLAEFRWGLDFNILHAREGHGTLPAWLAGRSAVGGFWYFFPVAFLIKTPVAFHVLMGIAVIGFVAARRPAGNPAYAETAKTTSRPGGHWLSSPWRMPVIAGLILLLFLVRSGLNIGFRHALPIMPFVTVLVAVGVMRLWRTTALPLRTVIIGLAIWMAGSVLSFYPHFLAYTSEYNGDRDRGWELLVDSSLDWGQGLIELREFMREENVDRVFLSYFGSAFPEAYGIEYVPLRSFFELPPRPEADERPEYFAISATHLAGMYVEGVFNHLRTLPPHRVLGHSMLVYRIRADADD